MSTELTEWMMMTWNDKDAGPWLNGIVPPIITPLTASGTFDQSGMERQVGRLLTAGVHGIFVLGSTGETAYLDDETRAAVVECVAGQVAGQVPVVVGVMETSPDRVSALARRLTTGRAVSGVVVTAPFYGRTHRGEIERHFRDVAAASPLPVVAYDVPAAVHVALDQELLVELANDSIICGVKDSSGADSPCRTLAARDDLPSSFSILTGSELSVDAALFGGCHGAVPGLANVDPVSYVRLYDHMCAGRWAQAREVQDRLIELFKIVSVPDQRRMGAGSAGVGAFKAAVAQLGVIESGRVASPLIPLSNNEDASIADILHRCLARSRSDA